MQIGRDGVSSCPANDGESWYTPFEDIREQSSNNSTSSIPDYDRSPVGYRKETLRFIVRFSELTDWHLRFPWYFLTWLVDQSHNEDRPIPQMLNRYLGGLTAAVVHLPLPEEWHSEEPTNPAETELRTPTGLGGTGNEQRN